MGNNFASAKKKTRLSVIILSMILGITVGAIGLAVPLLVLKLLGKLIPVWLYIIAGSLIPIAALISYLFIMPSDQRLAKSIDEDHALNEKMRTMVEFRNSNNAFALLQREDADEKFGKIKFSPWRKKQLITILVLFIVSIALLVTAFVLPGRDNTEPEKPLTEFDKQWIIAELSNVVATVEKSDIEPLLKTETLNELKQLISFVETHDYLSEMKLAAINAVINIEKSLKNTNSAPMLSEKLSLCTTKDLKDLGTELSKFNGNGVQKKINALKASSKENMSFIADELSAAISSSGANASSELVVILNNLVSSMRGYVNGTVSSIDDVFGTSAFDSMDQVMLQSFNKMTIQNAKANVCKLFGITEKDLVESGADDDIDISSPGIPPSEVVTPDDEKEENPELGTGGIGTGDRIYGSNDVIYNPYTNKYVPYGEVYDEYNNRLLEMQKDGLIPPDFEDFVNEYFRSLSDYEAGN